MGNFLREAFFQLHFVRLLSATHAVAHCFSRVHLPKGPNFRLQEPTGCSRNATYGLGGSSRARTGLRFERGQSFSGRGDLFGQASNHAASSIVLVQSMRQLLARRLQLLSQRERVQHHRVPFVLHTLEQRGNAGRRRWLRFDQRVH